MSLYLRGWTTTSGTGIKLPLTFTSYNCRGLGINRVYDESEDEDITKYDFISALLS